MYITCVTLHVCNICKQTCITHVSTYMCIVGVASQSNLMYITHVNLQVYYMCKHIECVTCHVYCMCKLSCILHVLPYICYLTCVILHVLFLHVLFLHVLSYMCYLTCAFLHMLSYMCYLTCVTLHKHFTCVILHALSYMCYLTCVLHLTRDTAHVSFVVTDPHNLSTFFNKHFLHMINLSWI